MTPYAQEISRSMDMLAKDWRTVFIGQAVSFPGTSMTTTLANIPAEKKLEVPVFEETQMGMSIGLALAGLVPVTLFTRWNFLLLAANQLINHLDKLPLISGYRPKVIVRTGIGSQRPMHPGLQHIGDYTGPFSSMSQTLDFIRLLKPDQIYPAYKHALERTDGRSTVLIEDGDRYNA